MSSKRVQKLNSLLREVISEVVFADVDNPNLSKFTSITKVDVTKDLQFAKVYVSIIGTEEEKKTSIDALQVSAGYISQLASKKVRMRHFPTLSFKIDTSVDKQIHIESLLKKLEIPSEQ